MKRWITFLLFVFALNFAWEMMQANWFASMRDLPVLRATVLCFRAALGDLVIAAVAFAITALVARAVKWPMERRVLVPAIVFVAVGLAITITYEVFALSGARWSYDETMPTLFGIGVLPLLQWLLLPIAEMWLFRLIFRRDP
ncbi:MAG TPA: hypothetical protein VGA84_04760 [Thermoanaerobaculia bacterium]